MNKKCTPLRNVKLDSPQLAQIPFAITDEMKEAFHTIANETAEEYAKRIPEPKIVRPNVAIQCDGTACKSVRDDVETIMTDIKAINENAKSIDGSLKTISNDLGKRPCMKCVPKELSDFYFRGHHIRTEYIFGSFTWFILTSAIVTIDSCEQQSAAETNMELPSDGMLPMLSAITSTNNLSRRLKTACQRRQQASQASANSHL